MITNLVSLLIKLLFRSSIRPSSPQSAFNFWGVLHLFPGVYNIWYYTLFWRGTWNICNYDRTILSIVKLYIMLSLFWMFNMFFIMNNLVTRAIPCLKNTTTLKSQMMHNISIEGRYNLFFSVSWTINEYSLRIIRT
jgi:hypothetical protein